MCCAAMVLGCGLGATKVRILPKAACTWKTVSAGCFLKGSTLQSSLHPHSQFSEVQAAFGSIILFGKIVTRQYCRCRNRLSTSFMSPATELFLWLWHEAFKLAVSSSQQKGRLKSQTAFVHPTNPSIPTAQLHCFFNAADTHHIRRGTQVHVILLRQIPNIAERAA